MCCMQCSHVVMRAERYRMQNHKIKTDLSVSSPAGNQKRAAGLRKTSRFSRHGFVICRWTTFQENSTKSTAAVKRTVGHCPIAQSAYGGNIKIFGGISSILTLVLRWFSTGAINVLNRNGIFIITVIEMFIGHSDILRSSLFRKSSHL